MRRVVAFLIRFAVGVFGCLALGTAGAYGAVAILKIVLGHPWHYAHGDDNWISSVGLVVGGAAGYIYGWKLGGWATRKLLRRSAVRLKHRQES